MSKPAVVFVPGFWEGPEVFSSVQEALGSYGYETLAVALPSTGTSSPNNPSMHDDIQAIRANIEPQIEEGNELLLAMHSAGGFLGSNATEGLSTKERTAAGKKGGVQKLVFLTGGVLDEGVQHGPLPFFDYQAGIINCISPETTLFSDFSPADAAPLIAKLHSQPASGWDGTVTYAGWNNTPSVYLCCEVDAVIPPALQHQMVEMAGSEVETCDAGHMVMLRLPEKVVEVIRKAAGEVL